MHFKSPENFLKDGYYEGWELDTAYIAVHGHGGGLNVGIREHNLDVIYLDENKVANNIFEFLHKLIPIINEDSFPNLDLDKIIKRFNNEEWEEPVRNAFASQSFSSASNKLEAPLAKMRDTNTVLTQILQSYQLSFLLGYGME